MMVRSDLSAPQNFFSSSCGVFIRETLLRGNVCSIGQRVNTWLLAPGARTTSRESFSLAAPHALKSIPRSVKFRIAKAREEIRGSSASSASFAKWHVLAARTTREENHEPALPLRTLLSNPSTADLTCELTERGFAFVHASDMRVLLESAGSLEDWAAFVESWDDLHLDTHMADGGRYRRRRHATYSIDVDGLISRSEHQAHYQSRDYNALNGGIARWFEPIENHIGDGPCMTTILSWCQRLFFSLSAATTHWHVEVHQFRIEAMPGCAGLPTPEGMHRDGVDHVLVLLVRRENIASGTTSIHDMSRQELGSFTLTDPLDAALVEDERVYHGVTAVHPIDASVPAYRDVLVVTFRRK